MNYHYSDIRNKISVPVLWWDENAVPRYETFHPTETANIYANEVVLLEIQCQNCRTVFHVCLSESNSARLLYEREALIDLIKSQQLHYGDPPNIGCCMSGPTMNSVPVRVLEYWRQKDMEWARDKEYEIVITPDWAKDTTS